MSEELDVLVVGSANMDLVAKAPKFPAPGETVVGQSFETFPGGKGANQAVAVARLGGKVAFVGCVGDDAFGSELLHSLTAAGVDTSGVRRVEGTSTGVALITVDPEGENAIVVVPGANGRLAAEDVRQVRDLFRQAKVLLLQLETTDEAVLEAMKIARDFGKLTVLNPAPARALEPAFLSIPDFVTPNETELEVLAGKRVRSVSEAEFAAAVLVEKGARNVVVTLGRQGSLYVAETSKRQVPAFTVESVDTTAAGDAFNGALAAALAWGGTLSDALRFANAAGALATMRMGAQTSMPSRGEVEALLTREGG